MPLQGHRQFARIGGVLVYYVASGGILFTMEILRYAQNDNFLRENNSFVTITPL